MNTLWLPVFLFLGAIGVVLPAAFGLVGLAPHNPHALQIISGLVVCNVVGMFGVGVILGRADKK